jgi:hypothetical protein
MKISNMKITLRTRDNSFVIECEIPELEKPPNIVKYGARYFSSKGFYDDKNRRIYLETTIHVIDSNQTSSKSARVDLENE